MNTLIQFFGGAWAQALGFTVLHSLWQALLIGVLVTGILRCVPSRLSTVRYAVAGSGLLAIFAVSVATFLYLLPAGDTAAAQTPSFAGVFQFSTLTSEVSSLRQLLGQATTFLHSIVPFVVLAWTMGTLLFFLRLFGGWWYTTRLKQQALPLDEAWTVRMNDLLQQFNIRRVVTLAESTMVQAPVVIGYLKPIILLPLGMCAGLSTTQLESILIHELVHIRRHDYLVNLLQSVVEALFFFNPFAWMISGILRQEREHCCDDAVVRHQGNALAYAHALATLEAARLSKAGVALSLAENKNQLLNRIKRLMEKSVKNYSPRERIIPVLLLVVGLMCASWLTVQSRNNDAPSQVNQDPKNKQTATDTTKKKKSASYEMRKITTTNDEGEADERVIETYDGDEDMHEIMRRDMNMDFDFDRDFNIDMQDFHVEIPPIPPIDIDIEPIEPIEPIDVDIPAINFRFDADQWEALGKQFEDQFGEHSEFAKRIEAIAERQAERADRYAERAGDLAERQAERTGEMAERQAERATEMAERQAVRAAEMAERQAERASSEEIRRLHDQNWKDFDEKMAKFERNMQVWEATEAPKMKALQDKMKVMEKNMKAFEGELHDQLVRDGYLGKDEKIHNMQWNDDGDITINDTKIKSSDVPKYRELHRKYFKGGDADKK